MDWSKEEGEPSAEFYQASALSEFSEKVLRMRRLGPVSTELVERMAVEYVSEDPDACAEFGIKANDLVEHALDELTEFDEMAAQEFHDAKERGEVVVMASGYEGQDEP
jgi:hypothetical protein